MDKLEEHIRKNRDDLDRYIPSDKIWKEVEKELKGKKSHMRRFISIAAMFIIILATGLIIFRAGYRWKEINGITSSNEGKINDNAGLKETEIYYTNLVNSLYREASPLLTGHPEIKKELTTDMSQLDSICSDIKKDLKDNVANQEVVEALIQNYRIKIRLLEDMLELLKENDVNPEKPKSHDL